MDATKFNLLKASGRAKPGIYTRTEDADFCVIAGWSPSIINHMSFLPTRIANKIVDQYLYTMGESVLELIDYDVPIAFAPLGYYKDISGLNTYCMPNTTIQCTGSDTIELPSNAPFTAQDLQEGRWTLFGAHYPTDGQLEGYYPDPTIIYEPESGNRIRIYPYCSEAPDVSLSLLFVKSGDFIFSPDFTLRVGSTNDTSTLDINNRPDANGCGTPLIWNSIISNQSHSRGEDDTLYNICLRGEYDADRVSRHMSLCGYNQYRPYEEAKEIDVDVRINYMKVSYASCWSAPYSPIGESEIPVGDTVPYLTIHITFLIAGTILIILVLSAYWYYKYRKVKDEPRAELDIFNDL